MKGRQMVWRDASSGLTPSTLPPISAVLVHRRLGAHLNGGVGQQLRNQVLCKPVNLCSNPLSAGQDISLYQNSVFLPSKMGIKYLVPCLTCGKCSINSGYHVFFHFLVSDTRLSQPAQLAQRNHPWPLCFSLWQKLLIVFQYQLSFI